MPDYTLPISINAIAIVSLPVDIKSQSVGNIGIDIKAQTLGTLNINIASSAATLNIAIQSSAVTLNVQIQNSSIAVTGSVTVSGSVAITNSSIAVTGAVTVSGSVAITNSSIAVTGAVTVTGTVAISGTVTVSGAVTVSGTVAISGSVTITGAVTITSGTVTFTNTTIAVTGTVAISGTVTVSGSVTVSGTVAISGTVTVSGSVTVSGTVAISGSVTVTGAVTVTGSVTISGAVTITSGAVTISTAAGTNIVLDLLTKNAYIDTRRTLSNNGAAVTVWDYTQGVNRIAKFFVKGCRGFLDNMGFWCKDAGAAGGTITVYIAPYIGAGYIYSGTVTIPAGGVAAWRYYIPRIFWNYDSLFVFFVCSSANMQIGRDADANPDAYTSTDSGTTWVYNDFRYWVSAAIVGQTVGDVGPSIVNNIEIPNVASALTPNYTDAINGGVTKDILATVNCSGKLIGFQGHLQKTSGTITDVNMYLGIVIDGITFEINMSDLGLSLHNNTKTGALVDLAEYDLTNYRFIVLITRALPFKQSLRIYARNDAAAGNYFSVNSIYSYEKLT